jgi:hypothetical protein
VRLTVDGRAYSQPLTLRMDPRVTTPAAGIRAQHALALRLHRGIDRAAEGMDRARQLQSAARAAGDEARARALEAVIGGGGRRFGGGGGQPSLAQVSGNLTQLLDIVDGADYAPTAQVRSAANAALQTLDRILIAVK